MRILFDQATPVPLRPYLRGHLIRTAAEEGWDRLKNGELLKAAESAGFNLLITTDQNMPHQQNMEGLRLAVMVLTRQQWPELRPHVDRIVQALASVQPGAFVKVDIPRTEPSRS